MIEDFAFIITFKNIIKKTKGSQRNVSDSSKKYVTVLGKFVLPHLQDRYSETNRQTSQFSKVLIVPQ